MKLQQIIDKYKRSNYDIVFYAKSFLKHRYELTGDTAGGTFTYGAFRFKKDAIKYAKEKKVSNPKIYDSWKSCRSDLLKDVKVVIRLLKLRTNL